MKEGGCHTRSRVRVHDVGEKITSPRKQARHDLVRDATCTKFARFIPDKQGGLGWAKREHGVLRREAREIRGGSKLENVGLRTPPVCFGWSHPPKFPADAESHMHGVLGVCTRQGPVAIVVCGMV